jgi:hypothetical protein
MNIYVFNCMYRYTKNTPAENWPDRNVALWEQSEAYDFKITDKKVDIYMYMYTYIHVL